MSLHPLLYAWAQVVVKRQLNTIGRTSAPVRSFVADVTRWTTQLGSNAAQSKSLFHLVLRRFDDFITAQVPTTTMTPPCLLPSILPR